MVRGMSRPGQMVPALGGAMPVRCQCRSAGRRKNHACCRVMMCLVCGFCAWNARPSARVSSPIKFNPKGSFASDLASSIIHHLKLSLLFIIFTKERSHWNSLVSSWSSPSFRRGTSSNRAITTSRGLPAYLGTKYPGTFLNSQHQENRVHLPAVLLPVCHQATTHRTLLLGPASNNFAYRTCLGADSSVPLSQADIRLITYHYSPPPSPTARHAPVVLYTS